MRAFGRLKPRFGFTLVEVMVALALFGVAISVLASAYVNVLNAMAAVQVDQGFEQDMALIRGIALTKPTLEELEEGGEVMTGSYGVVSWSAAYETTLVADLFQVTLTVELPDDASGELQEVSEMHYLTRPTWSDPVERAELRADTRDRLLARQTGLE